MRYVRLRPSLRWLVPGLVLVALTWSYSILERPAFDPNLNYTVPAAAIGVLCLVTAFCRTDHPA